MALLMLAWWVSPYLERMWIYSWDKTMGQMMENWMDLQMEISSGIDSFYLMVSLCLAERKGILLLDTMMLMILKAMTKGVWMDTMKWLD